MRKYFSVILFCLAVLLSLGAGVLWNAPATAPASAASREAEVLNENPPTNLSDLQNAGDEQLAYWAENLESFDGRTYNYITPARNQYDRNTCWAYAAVGAVEANILRSGIDADVTKDTLNLDETITAYTRHTRDGSQDPLLLTTDDTYNYGRWNQGDSAANAFAIMTQGYTLVEENNFHTSVSEEVLKSKLHQSEYYVKSYQHISDSISAIKRAILQYGAVTFNYSGPSSYLYYDPSAATNHTSIIVGWDDTVKSSGFKPQKPNGDGAWIVKNSWGNQVGYNEVNGTYCYYISYELPIGAIEAVEMAMTTDYQNIYHYDGNIAISLNKKAGEAQAAIYEAKLSSPTKQEQLKAVMISVPQDDLDVNIRVYKNLNANPGNVNDKINLPDKGDLAIEMDTHIDDSGMHTIDLERPVNLEQGEYFSIVVRCRTKSGVSVAVNCAVDERSVNDMTYYLQGDTWVNFKNSEYYADTGTDKRVAKIRAITNTVAREADLGSDVKYARVEIANRLVYYAKDAQLLPEMQVSFDGKPLEVGRDYRVEMQEIVSPGRTAITVFGEGEYRGARTTYFEVAKAKNAPAPVPDAMSVYNDVIYLHELPSPEGWEWVEDTKLEYGTNVVSMVYIGEDRAFYQNWTREFSVNKINQNPPADRDISTAEAEVVGEYVYTGGEIIPSVRVLYESSELRYGADYTLTFQDNVNAGTATVIVDGSGRYFGRVVQTFVIQKAEKPSVDTTIRYDKKVSKLSEIPLPNGFAWEDETMDVAGDRFAAKAVYVGEDAENYEITKFTFEIILEGQDSKQESEREEQEEETKQEGQEGKEQEAEREPQEQDSQDTNPKILIWVTIAASVAVSMAAAVGIALFIHRRKRR